MKSKRAFNWVLLTPVLIFLLLFLILPIVLLLVISFQNQNTYLQLEPGYTLSRYVGILTQWKYLKDILVTVGVALLTTAIALVLAYPAAYLLTCAPSKSVRSLLYVLLVSPLLTSVVVRTFAWIVLLSQNGILNQILEKLGLIQHPLSMLWNMNAVILAYVQVMLPFAVMPIATCMGEISPSLQRVSMSLGAGRIRSFFKITLPLTIPGMASGGIIVFALTAGSYITPLLVGGGMQPLLPLMIYQQAMQVSDIRLASALSIVLLVIVFIFILPVEALLKRWEVKVYG
ncbi:putative spermidine/putrescine transport system permease protein [Sporobacter termitidis DSM 10068]|uniref:Putative spermidine/putrescine transport system permease protein n=1 Tax=Sporobacter termitidis DSM 10068 TaxID=1123282 RepID=A0A1M5XB57_9FIRM|nr:ABC transporter permease [Sporobacter termitidis]SHH97095.1 putative spermidine/putrescine transport system permease protein [Sporobacter termitidis DSM 10068]